MGEPSFQQPNEVSSANGGLSALFAFLAQGPATAEFLRWAKQFMRAHSILVVAALAGANPCWCQERQPTNSPAQGVNSLSLLEAQVVGSWRFSVPEEETPGMTNAFLTLHLSADRSWSLTPGHPDSTHAESDTQSGRWFVHERVLVLRIDETKSRLIEKMATVYDIKSLTKTTLTVTNSPFGDMTWTRVAQPELGRSQFRIKRP